MGTAVLSWRNASSVTALPETPELAGEVVGVDGSHERQYGPRRAGSGHGGAGFPVGRSPRGLDKGFGLGPTTQNFRHIAAPDTTHLVMTARSAGGPPTAPLGLRLLLGFGLALFVLAAPKAQAFTCVSDLTVFPPFFNQIPFTDCSGTTNARSVGVGPSSPSLAHTPLEGPFKQNDWFTDLHITFLNASVTVTEGLGFFNITDDVAWNTKIVGNTVSFTAPTAGDRVDGDASGVAGDEYRWIVSFDGALTPELRVRIEYTMDVPEPGTGLLLMMGMLGLAGLRVRRWH